MSTRNVDHEIGYIKSLMDQSVQAMSCIVFRADLIVREILKNGIDLINVGRECKEFEEFIEKCERYSIYKKDPEEIANDLFREIPNSIRLNDIVRSFFNSECSFEIIPLLDALLIANPTYELSPLHKVFRLIVEDREHHKLTNSDLLDLIKQYNLDNRVLSSCYELAYRINHPYIYNPSQTTSDYSLNFLWVNLNPQDRVDDIAQNIFNKGLDPNDQTGFIYRISRWADAQPGAHINIWYDSALVTQRAYLGTLEVVNAISKSKGVTLQLKDIRKLLKVEGEIKKAFHPGTNVYFRVDLLKALIADYMMTCPDETGKYCVVSDIDVEPMGPQHLFDQRTIGFLSTSGYVFNRVNMNANDFENSFFIFNRDNQELHRVHNESILKKVALQIAQGDPYGLEAGSVFKLYSHFRKGMKEKDPMRPRKVVKCPPSQFNYGGFFSDSDFQKEQFHFTTNSDVPHTRFGRNNQGSTEHIEALKHWQAEPF